MLNNKVLISILNNSFIFSGHKNGHQHHHEPPPSLPSKNQNSQHKFTHFQQNHSSSISQTPTNKSISFTTSAIINNCLFDQAFIICNTNPLHFITLAFLFLPFTITTAAAIQLDLSSADVTFNTLTTFIPVIFFVIFSTLSGVALIIYSTYHTICHKPLTFTSIFKSLSHSFIPLLSTFIAATLKLAFISLEIILLGLGFQFDKTKISCVLGITILFYVLGWGLAPVIAVLESKKGFDSLRESVKIQPVIYRLKFYNMVLFRGLPIGSMLSYCDFLMNKESVSNWLVFVFVSAVHLQSSLIILNYVVLTTVLYVRAKAAGSGYVVVKTTMHVTHEDTRALMLGWFTHMMAIFNLINMMTLLSLMF